MPGKTRSSRPLQRKAACSLRRRWKEGARRSRSWLVSPVIANAVLGLAPFPVIVDASRRVDRFMAFKEEGFVTPTLARDCVAGARHGRLCTSCASSWRNTPAKWERCCPSSSDDMLAQRQLQATSLLIRQIVRGDRALSERLEADMAAPSSKGAAWSSSGRALAATLRGLRNPIAEPLWPLRHDSGNRLRPGPRRGAIGQRSALPRTRRLRRLRRNGGTRANRAFRDSLFVGRSRGPQRRRDCGDCICQSPR